jgi:hypothetical protein
MTGFVKKLRAKGYTARELAARWSLLPRQISRIGKAPKQIHLDALAGLPSKQICGDKTCTFYSTNYSDNCDLYEVGYLYNCSKFVHQKEEETPCPQTS